MERPAEEEPGAGARLLPGRCTAVPEDHVGGSCGGCGFDKGINEGLLCRFDRFNGATATDLIPGAEEMEGLNFGLVLGNRREALLVLWEEHRKSKNRGST